MTNEEAVVLFGVEPYGVLDSLQYACGLLDLLRQEWGSSWTEHDQKVRAGLSVALSVAIKELDAAARIKGEK